MPNTINYKFYSLNNLIQSVIRNKWMSLSIQIIFPLPNRNSHLAFNKHVLNVRILLSISFLYKQIYSHCIPLIIFYDYLMTCNQYYCIPLHPYNDLNEYIRVLYATTFTKCITRFSILSAQPELLHLIAFDYRFHRRFVKSVDADFILSKWKSACLSTHYYLLRIEFKKKWFFHNLHFIVSQFLCG